MTVTYQIITTGLGSFRAIYSNHGLASLDFPEQFHPVPAGLLAPSAEDLVRWQALTARALDALTSGKPPAEFPPLDISRGSDFQKAVWQQLLAIPWRQTKTYGEIARALGTPSGSRAVGAACGANPIPVIIPCHRVMAAQGRFGGFSGGLEWKRRLLQVEGVLLA